MTAGRVPVPSGTVSYVPAHVKAPFKTNPQVYNRGKSGTIKSALVRVPSRGGLHLSSEPKANVQPSRTSQCPELSPRSKPRDYGINIPPESNKYGFTATESREEDQKTEVVGHTSKVQSKEIELCSVAAVVSGSLNANLSSSTLDKESVGAYCATSRDTSQKRINKGSTTAEIPSQGNTTENNVDDRFNLLKDG